MRAGVAGDLGVEDDETGLQLGDPNPNPLAMLLEQLAALAFGSNALGAQRRVAQHLPDRHSRRFQAAEKFDPGKDGRVVVALLRSVSRGIGEQPNPLVIADRVGCQPRTPGEFADLHKRLSVVTTRMRLGLRARSKSSGEFGRRRRAGREIHLDFDLSSRERR